MNKKFSIILNSRARPSYLANLIYTIQDNSYNLNDIEIFVSLDDDDILTKNSMEFFGIRNHIKYEFIPRNRNLHERINNLANQTSGKFIWVLNDDTEILTKNWDLLVWPLIESYQNDIIYCRTQDNSCDKEKTAQYSSFPIISKFAVNKLGYFMHPDIVGLGGDVHIWRIYNSINRVIDLPINIRHILHENVNLVLNPDQTAVEMREHTYSKTFDFWNCDISEDIRKLNA